MRTLPILLFIAALPAHAAIYKIVDDNGRATYTDHLPHGVKPALIIPDLKPAPAPDTKAERHSHGKNHTASSSHFPKVDTQTQRKRDDLRRDLLKEELGNEERELAAARAAVGASRPGSDPRLLAEAVKLHEKNIEMLNKEMARIR
jgi:hypothetical protein